MISEDLHRHTKELYVLYVENDETVRQATQEILKEYFDHVDTAIDGAEALDLFKKFHTEHNHNYDIVITSLMMPHLGGKELCQILFEFDPHQKIIVISSSNEASSLIDLINMGIKKFITKPIQPQQLHDVISDVAHRIYAQKLKEEEYAETTNHNALLKRREELNLQKLERSLKTLEEFNDALNESGIVSKTDPLGNITYVNDQFCRISGYTRKELLGQNHRIINSGDMSASFFEKLWNAITAKKSQKRIFKNRSKDGSVYFVESLIKPIVNTEGEITEYISIAHDITRMMNSIEQANHAQKAKDAFFRNVSHEMRTPLNAIIGFTSLLIERLYEDQKTVKMLTVIEKNGQKLHQLIESVLDIQNIQHNRFQLHEKEFEPFPFFKSLVTFYEEEAHKKGVLFHHTVDTNLPKILIADPDRLHQAINAVLENAVKFTPKGGNVDFYTAYDHDKNILTVQIQDTGIGIDPKDQAKIFELIQLDGSVTRKYEGAGLGLTIAHAIVKKMNGTITVESLPNKGAIFLIAVPLTRP